MSSPPASGPDAFDGPGSDPYRVLQLPASASADDLRTAFRRLSKEVHPDTTTLPAAEAQEAFRSLRQAYALLSDPARRRAYDARRAVAAMPAAGGGVGRPSPGRQVTVVSNRPEPVRRALSGGEWFALVLLAVALVLSLVLGLGVAWARGAELVRQPSWWGELQQESLPPEAAPAELPTALAEPLAATATAAAPAPATATAAAPASPTGTVPFSDPQP